MPDDRTVGCGGDSPPGRGTEGTVVRPSADLATTAERGRGRRPSGIPRLTRDRLTRAGFALWIAGTVVAAISGPDGTARGLASVAAFTGLVLCVGGPLRIALRRRLVGERGGLASLPALAVIASGTVAGLATLIGAIALWATP